MRAGEGRQVGVHAGVAGTRVESGSLAPATSAGARALPHRSWHGDIDVAPQSEGKAPAPQHARRALERAGFRCLDADVLDLRFTGLAVYFFGAREPLSVRDLLFYWQD